MRLKVGVLTFMLVAFAVGSAEATTQWPGFRGPDGTGAVSGRLFEGDQGSIEVGWKRALGPGYSALAVGNGHVVAMFAEGDGDYLGTFSVESGDEVWRYRISDTYAGHDGSHDGPIATPLIHGDHIFGLGAWGHLFAVNAQTGDEVWSVNLVEKYEVNKPHYGFAASPVIAGGVLIIEMGAEGGKIAGFDPATGDLKWEAGSDEFHYGSPIVANLGGRDQVVAAGIANIYGLEASSGEILWEFAHGGDERAMGGATIVPLAAGKDRLFIMNKIDESTLLEITPKGDAYTVEKAWTTNGLKQSYVSPVYHDGHIYGMSNRVFTCLNAADGEIAWRSREPGDGFPTLVGDHLVIVTKPGTLHVAPASSDGYQEIASLELFDDHSWSEVAYADGHLFARSMNGLARIDLSSRSVGGEITDSGIASAFRRFIDDVESTSGTAEKTKKVETFLAAQKSFPIIEDSGLVHFVYYGDARDVGIVGDMIGFRREDPMHRVAGTNLFHYSTLLEPTAAVTYGFIVDFADPAPDPNNPSTAEGLFGEVSWFAMPAWDHPDFLDDTAVSRRGRLEELEWESEAKESTRKATIYLPPSYDEDGDRRYPVLYIHHGKEALESGRLNVALDHLIGDTVDPVIAVFVHQDEESPRDFEPEKYPKMILEELVPAIDGKYRTIAGPLGRATVGAGRAATPALVLAFQHPDVFGRVGGQSATVRVEQIEGIERGPAEQPMVIYLDWGTYHMRSPHEAWDLAKENRRLWSRLREVGYRPAGGEVPEGYGRSCWNGHTDEMLRALFPMRSGG